MIPYKSIAVGTCLCVVSAVGQNPATDKYRELSQQVYVRQATNASIPGPGDSDKTESSVKQLHDAVTATILSAVAKPGATSFSVRQAIVELQGDESLGKEYPETQMPVTDLTNVNGVPMLMAGFAVMSGGIGIPDIRSYVQFYSLASGSWKLLQEVGSDFRGTAFSVSAMKSPQLGQAWYFVWGVKIGDSGARLRAQLYAFNGVLAKKLWERDDLKGGHATASSDRIVLEYFEFSPEGTRLPPIPKVEVFRPTANGLERE